MRKTPEVNTVSDAADGLPITTAGASIIKQIVRELRQAAKSDGSDNVRMFFPNGIERIYFNLSLGAQEKPGGSLQIEISGGKRADQSYAPEINNAVSLFALSTPTSTSTRTSTIAADILKQTRITLATAHSTTPKDEANAKQNIVDCANGNDSARSAPSPPGRGNPLGGRVALASDMLSGMLALAEDYTFSISEVCGGKHTATSRHYAGVAFDVSVINGAAVSKSHPNMKAFKEACKTLGATEFLGPGDQDHDSHIHAAWPRPLGSFEEQSSAEQYLG